MKRFIQIEKSDSVTDIPSECVNDVINVVAPQVYGETIASIVINSPTFEKNKGNILGELVAAFFKQKPDGTIFVEAPNEGVKPTLNIDKNGSKGEFSRIRNWIAEFDASKERIHIPTQVIHVTSDSRAGLVHTVKLQENKAFECSCEGFTHRGTCKHLAKAESRVS